VIDEITYALTDPGLRGPRRRGSAAKAGGFLRWATWQSAEKHPTGSALQICQVDTERRRPQDHLRCTESARQGITVVVANRAFMCGIDQTTGRCKSWPVESFGMMASEAASLNLSEEHDGIIELPSGNVGDLASSTGGENDPPRCEEPLIEIAITPTTARCFWELGAGLPASLAATWSWQAETARFVQQ